MSDRFYFGSPADTDSDDNDDSLPFPKPLDRSAFLAPTFDPAGFLSSLSDRFQTLEDLQNELRELVQSLNKELVDLVNDNYQDFLSLGSTLAGGEEKVEEIRVGLLGFQRDVQGVRDKVETRRQEIGALLREKKALKTKSDKGRMLLEYAERVDDLEHHLRIAKAAQPSQLTNENGNDELKAGWSEEWNENVVDDSDEDYDDEGTGISSRLKDAVGRYLVLRVIQRKFDPHHPFLSAQRERVSRIYDIIRQDLETSAKQEDDVKTKQKIIQLRSSLED